MFKDLLKALHPIAEDEWKGICSNVYLLLLRCGLSFLLESVNCLYILN